MNSKNLVFSLLLLHLITIPVTYRLTHPPYNPGLFSVFNTVLGALDFYENSDECDGLIVDFEDRGLFYNKDRGDNWWEYYFEPIQLNKNNSFGAEKKFPSYKKTNFSLTTQFEMSRDRSNELIQKYVRLKPVLQHKLDTFIKDNFHSCYIIGVHYRGTDKKSEAPAVSYETVRDHLNAEIAQRPDAHIFVATDDAHFLAFMKQEFPERVIALDAIRSENGKPLHLSGPESTHQRGEEAVLDCLLLSRCSKLYKMASNLSDCSIKFNPSIQVIELNRSYSQEISGNAYDQFGFFSLTFNAVLALLDRYEQKQLKGVHVNFPICGTEYEAQEGANWWELNFMPLSVGEDNVTTAVPQYAITTLGSANLFEMSATRAHELIMTYINLQPHILNKIDAFAEQELADRLFMGIYYHTSPTWLHFLQPPVDYEMMLNRIKEEINKIPNCCKLFLATNDETFFTKMQELFPDLVYFYKPSDKEKLTKMQKEELDLIHCILLSKMNKVIGTSTTMFNAIAQFNPETVIIALDTLWWIKE